MSEEEYQRSLSAVVQKIRTAMTIKQSLERHIQLARKTGRTDLEIGDDIRAKLRGELPDDTIRKYLPPSLKHQEKTNLYLKHDAGLIPHPPPAIIEIEPERPKPAQSGIVKIVFDPAPIDRDRTQVFIIHYDISTNTIKKYETVGRRTLGK